MDLSRILAAAIVTVTLTTSASMSHAQSANSVDDIQNLMVNLYPTAVATADGTDIVTAGAVIILQKDHLVMNKVEFLNPTFDFYKDGAISLGRKPSVFASALASLLVPAQPVGNQVVGNPTAPDTREFVTGDKFWVTKIESGNIGVAFHLMSDPIKDQRYKAVLIFQWAKGATPTSGDVAARVSEVIRVAATDASADQSAEKEVAQKPTETKTIAIGQTRDQVISVFGAPTKIVRLGAKEIDYFPDMKVTFVKNKVTDVN